MRTLLAVLVLAFASIAAARPATAAGDPHLSARSNYLERCGGCHGVDGRAFAATVPDLAGKAGYFLCDPAGRDYIARLPNIVFSRLTDPELTALLNYVAFDLGGASTPAGARRYTPAEVALARRRALSIPDLEAYRARVVQGLISRCGAPQSLASDYVTAGGPQ
jgi:mono/diheme cytochrome c family protein